MVFEPKPGRFPDRPPPPSPEPTALGLGLPAAAPVQSMGVGAGGRMRQKIYPDPHGIDAWDPQNRGPLCVHLVNSEQYRELTGQEPPPSPVDARTYTDAGLPWFDLYDEDRATLAAGEPLARVRTVTDVDRDKGGRRAGGPDESVAVPETQVHKLHPPGSQEGARPGRKDAKTQREADR